MYLRYLGELTSLHLRILLLFRDPAEWFRSRDMQPADAMAGSRAGVIEAAFPELESDRDLYVQVWRELVAMDLVRGDDIQTQTTSAGAVAPTLSESGRRFVSFVTTAEPSS